MGQAVVMAEDVMGSQSLVDATHEAMQDGGIPQQLLVVDGRQTGTEVVTGQHCHSWAREAVAGELWMLLLGDE
jgi:hypothetical protein